MQSKTIYVFYLFVFFFRCATCKFTFTLSSVNDVYFNHLMSVLWYLSCIAFCRKDEVYKICPGCPATCQHTEPYVCFLPCVAKCVCRPGLLRDEKSRKCVKPDDCPNRRKLTTIDSQPEDSEESEESEYSERTTPQIFEFNVTLSRFPDRLSRN